MDGGSAGFRLVAVVVALVPGRLYFLTGVGCCGMVGVSPRGGESLRGLLGGSVGVALRSWRMAFSVSRCFFAPRSINTAGVVRFLDTPAVGCGELDRDRWKRRM